MNLSSFPFTVREAKLRSRDEVLTRPRPVPPEPGVLLGFSSVGRHRPIAIDLFCGAGGFSLGAQMAGFDVALAVDLDPNSCATYQSNLVDRGLAAEVRRFDISKFDPRSSHYNLGLHGQEVDLVIGGPPCQGFSTHRLNNSGVNDPRNQLVLKYFEIVSLLRPKYFLIENVPGILWPRHRLWLDMLYEAAHAGGYKLTDPLQLNAADYGVPQRRKRVFILGTRADVAEVPFPPTATHCDPKRADELRLIPWQPASIAFEGSTVGDPNDNHMQHGKALTDAFINTPVNGGSRTQSGRTLDCHRAHNGHSDVYGRIDPSQPSPTMTTACINPSKGRFVHPTKPHGITVREAARLQTFPDWFVFGGGLMASGVQIGNAVPPALAAALIAPLAEACRRYLTL